MRSLRVKSVHWHTDVNNWQARSAVLETNLFALEYTNESAKQSTERLLRSVPLSSLLNAYFDIIYCLAEAMIRLLPFSENEMQLGNVVLQARKTISDSNPWPVCWRCSSQKIGRLPMCGLRNHFLFPRARSRVPRGFWASGFSCCMTAIRID